MKRMADRESEADILTTPRSKRLREKKPTQEHGTGCTCTACTCEVCEGLVCLERPRFFSGQLLSEAELTSQQEYVRAKNRLHNRYLHGWGIVCGLEVVCHPCEGWVTIRQGYALDPCGEDIVVCEDHDFNLVGHLKDCLTQRRRRADCDPYRPRRQVECPDDVEHWCVTLAYEEKTARPITALRRACGNGQEAIACEPTRILENYRIGLVESSPECCEDLWSLLRPQPEIQGGMDDFRPVGTDASARLEKQLGALFGALGDTLLERVVGCVVSVNEFIAARVKNGGWKRLLQLLSTSDNQLSLEILYQDLKSLHRAVCQLYAQDPHDVECAPLDDLELCEPPHGKGNNYREDYINNSLRPDVEQLMSRVVQYAIDCVCHELLPTCPPSPHDERLILACVTVQRQENGDYEILRICNTSCRRYAGSFPNWSYWLSLVPVVPLIGQLVKVLCCTPIANEAVENWPRNQTGQLLFGLLADGEYGRLVGGLAGVLGGPFYRRFVQRDQTAAEALVLEERERLAAHMSTLEERDKRAVAAVAAVEKKVGGLEATLDERVADKVNERVSALDDWVVAAVNERATAADSLVVERVDEVVARVVGERMTAAAPRFAEADLVIGLQEQLKKSQAQLKKSQDQITTMKKDIANLKRQQSRRGGGGEG
jgi:hypothetical protein